MMARLLVSALVVLTAFNISSARAQAPGQASASPAYVVLIVLDGARPDYFHVHNIPHVQALMQHGTRYPNAWSGILESETPSGHAAIGSGVEPRSNGILGFGWADTQGRWVNLLDPAKVRAGELEQVLRNAHAPSIAAAVHGANPHDLVVALGGYKYYAHDAMAGPNANYIMYFDNPPNGGYRPTAIPGHVPPKAVLEDPALTTKTTNLPLGAEDHLAMKMAIDSFQRMHQRVSMINLPEFDRPLGHIYGASLDPGGVRTLMQGFDRDLGQLEDTYQRAGVLSRTIFVITADHGFAPMTYTIPKPTMAALMNKVGGQALNDMYHTAAYIWLKNPSRAKAAGEAVAGMSSPYIQSVYYKASSPAGVTYVRLTGLQRMAIPQVDGANQFLLHTFAGPTSPDIVVVFTEEAAGLPHRALLWKGDHGGTDWESQHIPLIIAGPGVRANAVSYYPARLIDLAPTVLSLMGITAPSAMQGVPLADAMQAPPAGSVDAQARERAAVKPIVALIKKESRLELAARR